MTTARTKASSSSVATDANEAPWYDLINDAPEPPEDAMQQATTIHYVMTILKARYENDATTLWSNQTNIIYDSNIPGSVGVPDGYIVFGVDARTIEMERRSYRIEEWGVPPAFVLEVASESTAHRDLGDKREIYASMGAQEYWRLDRNGEYYGEPLVGEQLVDGAYVPCELRREANGDVWSRSEVLGVDFYHRVEDGVGRFLLRDSESGEWLGDLSEEIEARQTAEMRAQEAEGRNQELQAEVERLRRQLGQQ